MHDLFQWLKKTLGGMVTEHDNQTHDLIKHGGWIGLLAVLAHDAYQLAHGVGADVKDLAIAIAAVLTATGVGVGVKRGSEHDEEVQGGPQ
jgi:hypothetical protein